MNNSFLRKVIFVLQRFLPIWIILCSVIAFVFPSLFSFLGSVTPWALAFIFLLMGMSISFDSFMAVLKKPQELLLGMAMKWMITVGISVLLAYLFFRDNASLAAGIILAGTVPSGTSANVYTLLAGGTVELSIALATIDTFIAPFMTPYLMQLFAGQFIPVSFWTLFLNIVYIVFVPIAIGVFLQWRWGNKITSIRPFFPLCSVVALLVIVVSVTSNAYESIIQYMWALPSLFLVVFIQVALPMVLSYLIAKYLCKFPEATCRALLFHVGICNTALSATLAMNHIDPLAAVPSVVNMVINLSLGALVANLLVASKKNLSQDTLKS
ncbi:bile acid:sodium symporter family protein [Bacillus sp. FJAT-45350]|uniref:bile acid:sodium symporter family protein n=1 Tax=Bacillus sp. FJAT-45350 TaxID=2011014 RepID=UPI000BB7580C|nr:bile acid:sodium symporter family protein [Bacillus sp. FJAT-45350]